MNQKKQRITIAKACGWTDIQPGRNGYGSFTGNPTGVPAWYKGKNPEHNRDPLPDYLNSLDAMCKAVDAMWALDPYFGQTFSIKLTEVATGLAYSAEVVVECLEDVVTATAAEWAEAFLKTLGLWTEEE